MTERPRTYAILIAFLSLRRPVDFLIKPVFVGLFICLYTFGVEYYLHKAFLVPFPEFVIVTFIASLPFSSAIFLVVTYLDRLQERLGAMAHTDPLTQLPNRRAFLDWAGRVMDRIERADKGVVMLIDADRFKEINDTWGHPAGDLCLKRIAERLVTELRPYDVMGRVGGEEFAVFLPGVPMELAYEVALRLCRPFRIDSGDSEEPIQFTLSIGMAAMHDRMPLEEVVAHADAALYRAKANGRARVEIWDGRPVSIADVA